LNTIYPGVNLLLC